MQVINKSEDLNLLENGNIFIGTPPIMVNSTINFYGKNNILFCDKNVRLVNTKINFKANNSIVFLCENSHEYKIDLNIHNNSALYIGKNTYFNGVLNISLSEQKHMLVGDDVLFSFGIWARTADPHLVYDSQTKYRINPSKSVYIGDHVWIGQGVMLLKGTQIHSGSIIGAMSVVAGKKIMLNSSWAGNPVKKIKENVFWNHPCVHTWTDKETKAHNQMTDPKYIFNYDPEEYISFDEIDKKLDEADTAQKKFEFLTYINGYNKKNRFAYKTPEKRFFKRLKK